MSQIPSQIPSQIRSQLPTVPVSDVADDAIILDVRESDEWAAGHAPGAIHIPLGELPARLAELSDAGADTGAGTVAVTCRGGGRSSRAVAWLTEQGYHVANLDGGMKAWQAAGKPMVADGDVAPEVR
jgi:rhodanese-related sulfurtransferase